jgi:hypothetical protein
MAALSIFNIADAEHALSAPNQLLRYSLNVVRTTLWPETSSCSRSKTFWTCLSVRFVFVARSNSSAILSAFLLFVSFVEIRRCLPF